MKEEFANDDIVKHGIKMGLEGLNGKIEGMVEMRIHIDPLPTSSAEICMDSAFETVEDLKAYQTNALHEDVAATLVRPYVDIRSCFDYEF